MSVLVIAELHFKPDSGGADRFVEFERERLTFIRTRDGCQEIYMYTDQDDPNHIVLVEKWVSRAHHEKHQQQAKATVAANAELSDLVSLLMRETTTYLNKFDE